MHVRFTAHRLFCAAAVFAAFTTSAAFAATSERPKAGKVEIFKLIDVKPGMQATAWTVFSGYEVESVPIEIIGISRNGNGPKQDLIIAKMGGKAQRTNVAGGMSGSPVYIDGKLVGAVAFRLSVFSPDAICGITPIESMLEINDYDTSRPSDARTPDRNSGSRASVEIPGELLNRAVSAGQIRGIPSMPSLTPIATPLVLSGFSETVLREFLPLFEQIGAMPVQGGSSGAVTSAKPVAGWQNSLQPGSAVAGVLVAGDMNVTGMGTVTYNDGKRVLAFGHPFFNLGPVEMPMAKSEIVTVLASAFQPNKMGNATDIVGALKQDRHAGIMGELGAEARMIPVTVKVRGFDNKLAVLKEKELKFSVFVQQKWTPYLMMLTLFNSLEQMNDYSDDATYRLSGLVEMDGTPNISLHTMQAPSEVPAPTPMILAGWWGDKFNKLFLNAVEMPKLKSVNVTVDLLPERRQSIIESAWTPASDVAAGQTIPVKVFLRPYRGDRHEREFNLQLPEGLSKGEHRILLSDADTLNRMHAAATSSSRYMDIPQTVSLINQERSNNKIYVSLVEARPTFYADDRTMPSLPGSVQNILQSGRTASKSLTSTPDSAKEQMTLDFDQVVSGSYSLRIVVR